MSGHRVEGARAGAGARAARHAWRVVLAGGVVMGLALGIRHVQGLFLLPVSLDRGWPRDVFALALALQNLAWGLAQPLAGMIADRRGCRPVVLAGLVAYVFGIWGMIAATSPLGFVLCAGALIGVALSGTAFGVVYGGLARMVAPERRAWALGLAGAVGGLGQFVLVPVAQGLISWAGWAVALGVLALLLFVALPLALPLDDRGGADDEPAQSLGDALREAFAHRGFWLLNAGFVACGFQLAFIAGHLPAYLLDRGFGPQHGMIALALIALANVAGTYVFGLLGGHWRRKRLLATIYFCRAIAIALFVAAPPSTAMLYAFSVAMGLLWLGVLPLTTGLIAQVFGLRYVTTLFGFAFFGHQVGAFFGAWLGGSVYESTGSYLPVWLGAIGLGLMATVLHLPIDDRRVTRPVPRASPA